MSPCRAPTWSNGSTAPRLAVSTYLGRFPVKHLLVTVHGGGHEPIGGGVTHGDSRIDVRLGPSVKRADLNQDWIMTHEMFHLAFPTLDRRYLWMMEGLSDYLEPIARARAGQWTAQDAWREFVEGLPQGLPGAGSRGLDHDHALRDRIYWGGNIYWLLADVRIRVQTNNKHSLDDAIRAHSRRRRQRWPRLATRPCAGRLATRPPARPCSSDAVQRTRSQARPRRSGRPLERTPESNIVERNRDR